MLGSLSVLWFSCAPHIDRGMGNYFKVHFAADVMQMCTTHMQYTWVCWHSWGNLAFFWGKAQVALARRYKYQIRTSSWRIIPIVSPWLPSTASTITKPTTKCVICPSPATKHYYHQWSCFSNMPGLPFCPRFQACSSLYTCPACYCYCIDSDLAVLRSFCQRISLQSEFSKV